MNSGKSSSNSLAKQAARRIYAVVVVNRSKTVDRHRGKDCGGWGGKEDEQEMSES